MEGRLKYDTLQSILIWSDIGNIQFLFGTHDGLVSYSVEVILQLVLGGKSCLVKFIKVSQCSHSPENLFLGMQTLERIKTTYHRIVSIFKYTILCQQLHSSTIILSLCIVLKALTFLYLDKNI
jgi:hypothetical protein